MTTTTTHRINGLDTAALGGLVELLKDNPQGGRVTFATRSRWQDGARVLTRVAGYGIDGQPAHEDERRFVLLSDEPTELSGTDAAAGPAEQLMHAVAGCIAATINANAAFMGVTLTRLEVDLEGDIDLHGIFGLDETVRPGFGELRAKIGIAGDADPDRLQEIAVRGLRFSPIRESVENGVRIRAEVKT
jgi:uncharacterized OsmC-like protein